MATTTKKAAPAKKTAAADKPATKKTTAAKPVEKKTTTTKPAAKKTTTAKPTAKVSETKSNDSKKFSLKGLFSKNDSFKDPYEKNMVKVCAGESSKPVPKYEFSSPFGDKRKKKVWHRAGIFFPKYTVKEFLICKYHVTQKQWKMVMGEGFNPTKETKNLGDDNPVIQFSKEQLDEFLAKLNKLTGKKYRLPTEYEWDWARKGAGKDKDRGEFAGCNSIEDLPKYAWGRDNSDNKLHPVGKKKSNELGLYDMNGNCFDLCTSSFGRFLKDGKMLEEGALACCGGCYCSYFSCSWPEDDNFDCEKIWCYVEGKICGLRLVLDV